MKILEKFISIEPSHIIMTKDSELVKEVEDFLKENSIKSYLLRYDRGIYATEHENHPYFEIEIKNLKSLENMAKKLSIPVKQEYHRMHKCISIEKEQCSIYIYHRYE